MAFHRTLSIGFVYDTLVYDTLSKLNTSRPVVARCSSPTGAASSTTPELATASSGCETCARARYTLQSGLFSSLDRRARFRDEETRS